MIVNYFIVPIVILAVAIGIVILSSQNTVEGHGGGGRGGGGGGYRGGGGRGYGGMRGFYGGGWGTLPYDTAMYYNPQYVICPEDQIFDTTQSKCVDR